MHKVRTLIIQKCTLLYVQNLWLTNGVNYVNKKVDDKAKLY